MGQKASLKFTKMHGAGNDYVVVDARAQERDWASLALRLADRHFGVGSDGLLLVAPSSIADVRMRMFNPDGSEAEMCGNGIRCFAKFVLERDIARPGDGVLSVETGAGVLTVIPHLEQGRVVRAQVDMGPPRLRPEEVPVRLPEGAATHGPLIDYPLTLDGRTLAVTCLSMGNPHAVAFIQEPIEEFPLERLGPQVEHHPLFPNRVNFEVANVLEPGQVHMRTWERGAGETLACGTGACAVAVAARLKGLIGEQVDIELLGGLLTVRWDGQGPVWLEGPAEEVFEGEWRG